MDKLLENALNNGICLFTFLKKDGTHRVALGTRNVPLLDNMGFLMPTEKSKREPSPSVLCYFDFVKGEWRCCLRTNLLTILRTNIPTSELGTIREQLTEEESGEQVSMGVENKGGNVFAESNGNGKCGIGVIYGESKSGVAVESKGGELGGGGMGIMGGAIELPADFGELVPSYIPKGGAEKNDVLARIMQLQSDIAEKQAELNKLVLAVVRGAK